MACNAYHIGTQAISQPNRSRNQKLREEGWMDGWLATHVDLVLILLLDIRLRDDIIQYGHQLLALQRPLCPGFSPKISLNVERTSQNARQNERQNLGVKAHRTARRTAAGACT